MSTANMEKLIKGMFSLPFSSSFTSFPKNYCNFFKSPIYLFIIKRQRIDSVNLKVHCNIPDI